MSTRPDVVVVGAGIVGLSIAFQLSRRGAAVTVLDRAGIGPCVLASLGARDPEARQHSLKGH